MVTDICSWSWLLRELQGSELGSPLLTWQALPTEPFRQLQTLLTLACFIVFYENFTPYMVNI